MPPPVCPLHAPPTLIRVGITRITVRLVWPLDCLRLPSACTTKLRARAGGCLVLPGIERSEKRKDCIAADAILAS